MNEFAVITKWIIAFLIIFLLCMVLIFHFVRKRNLQQQHWEQQRKLEQQRKFQAMYHLF